MDPKKGRRVRKIEIQADTPTKFELGDTAPDIERMNERQQREREEEEAQKQQRES